LKKINYFGDVVVADPCPKEAPQPCRGTNATKDCLPSSYQIDLSLNNRTTIKSIIIESLQKR